MTTPSAPSARPPSSRRFEAIDSPAARAFVEAADSAGEGGAQPSCPAQAAAPPVPAPPPARPVPTLAAVPVLSPPPPPAEPAGPLVPASAPRSGKKERLQPVALRMPEAVHAQLVYSAENSPKSINQFVLDALGPAIAAEVEKIAKRKAMGLD